ncbi:MAG: DUF2058 domain-containing protein [Desulfobulbaceae bacterium]|nr:DUF2058 domain-containing protein [Desulfobulbaceae bacterium]
MSNSLSAQLLKAGLVNKKQVGKAKQEQYKKQKMQKKQLGKKGAAPVPESKQLARQAKMAEKERVQKLNNEQQEQGKKKELKSQIGQMINDAKLKIGKGDLTYNFAHGSKIKKLYISKEIRDQLGKGQLAIVLYKGQYQVVPTSVAKKIAVRDMEAVIVMNEPQQKSAEDDPYAEFPIPEDLEW